MPTYEYACTSCHHEWEFEQSIKADPLTECPACKAQTAKRQISRGTGFILKGGGWYSDLYSGASNAKSGDGEAKVPAGSKAPAESTASKSDAQSSGTSAAGSSAAASSGTSGSAGSGTGGSGSTSGSSSPAKAASS